MSKFITAFTMATALTTLSNTAHAPSQVLYLKSDAASIAERICGEDRRHERQGMLIRGTSNHLILTQYNKIVFDSKGIYGTKFDARNVANEFCEEDKIPEIEENEKGEDYRCKNSKDWAISATLNHNYLSDNVLKLSNGTEYQVPNSEFLKAKQTVRDFCFSS